jgi:hypothetical protein
MDQRRVRTLLRIGAGAAVFGVGVLGGMVLERTWYQPRQATMLEGVERTIRAYEVRGMPSESGGLPEAPRLNRPSRSSQ